MDEKTYQETLLKNAPPHDSEEFLQYLRDNNEVVAEFHDWLVIRNVKYGWLTAFAKSDLSQDIWWLIENYGDREWHVKPKDKRSVNRFHIHIK